MTTATAEQIQALPLAQLSESPVTFRSHYPDASIQELAQNIRAVGRVLVPLLVRPRDGKPGYEIVAGRRRFRAARELKLASVPVIVRPMSDQEALEIQVIENLQREDLSELDEARAFKALLGRRPATPIEKSGDLGVIELARRLGKSPAMIYARLKLLELIPKAATALAQSQITAGHAIQIARLQPKDQDRAVQRCVQRDTTVKELGDWMRVFIHRNLDGAPWKKDDATLLPKAGACTTCPKRDGKMCLDPGCYQEKLTAFVASREQILRAMKAPAGYYRLRVSERSSARKDGPLGPADWKDVQDSKLWPKKCPDTKRGVVVATDQWNRRELGKVYPAVCGNRKCGIHWGADRASRVSSARDKAARAKFDFQRKLCQQIFHRVIARSPASLGPFELEIIIAAYLKEIWHETRKRIAEAWWPELKRNSYNLERQLAVRARKLKPAQRFRFLLSLALARDLMDDFRPKGRVRPLEVAARRYRVNIRAVEKSLRAEARAKTSKHGGNRDHSRTARKTATAHAKNR